MSKTIIAQKTIIKLHIVWDGAYCFLNRRENNRITDDARPIPLDEAKRIVSQAQQAENAEISSRGRVSFDNPPHQWSWMATIRRQTDGC